MMRALLFSVLCVTSSVAFSADPYFQLSQVSIQEISNDANSDLPFTVAQDCSTVKADTPADMLLIDQIVNIGKIVWSVVQAGTPVVSSKFDTANALPRGVGCWTDLAGWSVPRSRLYNVQYKNGFGMVVVDFTYRLMFTAGGSVNGIGKYITNATFVPAELNVAWGFKFDAEAQIPSVTNIGTHENPLAAMQMNMHWKVDSPVSHDEITQSYFITGEGYLVQMN